MDHRNWQCVAGRWAAVTGWALVIFYLSGIPYLKTSLGTWDLVLRKAAHLVEYGIFAILVFRALQISIRQELKNLVWIALVLSIGYAISDEYHQSFVPGRQGSPFDVLIDSIGALMALAGWHNIRSMFRSRCLMTVVGCSFLFLSGCGPNYHFTLGKFYESRDMLARANHHYQMVVDRYPHRSAEALFYQGENFRQDNVFQSARTMYSRVMKDYPKTKWARSSMESFMITPDFFPLTSNFSWVEGDSQSGGKNMKIYSTCTQLKKRARITRKYYAGKKQVKELFHAQYFDRKNFELRQYRSAKDPAYSIFMKYPPDVGTSWQTAREGSTWAFRVVDNDAAVSVKAGRFYHCIKISERNTKLKGVVKYTYYAPGVGRILTTVKTGMAKEYRQTELLSYKKKSSP